MQVVTRFAPSPTGLLHLGHVFAADIAWRAARDAGGQYLVRLEDIDPQRCRPEFAAACLEDLAWLGLASDLPVRVQSAHLAEFDAVLHHLAQRGLVYPCFCSRADIAREIAAAGAAPHPGEASPAYPGTCRHLSPAERRRRLDQCALHAWRLDMAAALDQVAAPALGFVERGLGWVAADPRPFGDVLLGRRDVPASYHLCVTHDDAAQGVTLVTRAEDLRPAAHLHVLLQRLLGWATPQYWHHALLCGDDGVRLSKRHGAAAVRDLRARGVAPEAVRHLARQHSVNPPPA